MIDQIIFFPVLHSTIQCLILLICLDGKYWLTPVLWSKPRGTIIYCCRNCLKLLLADHQATACLAAVLFIVDMRANLSAFHERWAADAAHTQGDACPVAAARAEGQPPQFMRSWEVIRMAALLYSLDLITPRPFNTNTTACRKGEVSIPTIYVAEHSRLDCTALQHDCTYIKNRYIPVPVPVSCLRRESRYYRMCL